MGMLARGATQQTQAKAAAAAATQAAAAEGGAGCGSPLRQVSSACSVALVTLCLLANTAAPRCQDAAEAPASSDAVMPSTAAAAVRGSASGGASAQLRSPAWSRAPPLQFFAPPPPEGAADDATPRVALAAHASQLATLPTRPCAPPHAMPQQRAALAEDNEQEPLPNKRARHARSE
jgi:hypothetical protein